MRGEDRCLRLAFPSVGNQRPTVPVGACKPRFRPSYNLAYFEAVDDKYTDPRARLDTTVFDPVMLEHLVERYGAEHVLLGTDYPYDMGLPDPLALIADARITEADKELIAGGNARRLLKIVG